MQEGMWFGTRENPQWVPNVMPGADFIKTGWSSKSQYLNGGARIRTSKAAHREYLMVWHNASTRDALRPVTDYADGVYDVDDGANLIYFVTPEAADKNCAPQGWAFPAQPDARPLILNAEPVLELTPANALLYPARSATYTLTGTEVAARLYVPIAPGYVAWVGAHGSATGATGMRVVPFTDAVEGTATDLTLLAVTDTTRVNASFSSASGYTGIEVNIIEEAGTLTLSGLIIQMLRVGVTPGTGKFISGQGNSGCMFEDKPQPTLYAIAPQAGIEAIGMTAKLVEVGDHL